MMMVKEELDIELSVKDAQRMATTFKGLADPTRLKILAVLLQGEACVSDLAERVQISQSAVSHQLQLLRHLRFVSARVKVSRFSTALMMSISRISSCKLMLMASTWNQWWRNANADAGLPC